MAAVVQAGQDARRKFGGCGSQAEASPAVKVVEEGLQGLVQDLVGGFSRMDVAPARPAAGPGVQFLDVPALQGAFDIVGDSHPVGARPQRPHRLLAPERQGPHDRPERGISRAV